MLDDLILLASINSGSHNRRGLEAMCRWFETAFQILNPDKVERIDFENGPGLTACKRQEAPIQIFLGGHLDTVFGEESPFQTVGKVENNTIVGPGVTDMKGGLIVMLEALKAFENDELANNIGWRIFLNPDEELGSPYSADAIKTFAKGVDFALIFEPPLPDGSMIKERKGSVNYVVHSHGKAAHLGRHPEHGKCAITPLVSFLDHVAKLSEPNKHCIVGIGTIEGGQASNQVADHASATINVRAWETKLLDQIDAKLRKLADKYHVELKQLTKRPPKHFDPLTQKLFDSYFEAIGKTVKLESTGGVCDGNLLAECHIPTIDTLGVVGKHIHTHHEYLEVKSLEEKAFSLTQFLLHVAKRGCHEFSCRQTSH